ncbi:simple sugar transport system permease protein [Anaerosphaera aminiphila DSM 21120]|uniref:Simple sugar transport system permease protein n=1 Tax=Anaerosphaera aminiphila DSM 21120 TaxID=1120995 RepID=A0A1M5QED7_9FIRM|nr:ABC transporter [Anaerosphaera aminiphila]SHH12220.1 simple sugar transport system permease protein [Anaerosphaera aminiphila DSM 21120]
MYKRQSFIKKFGWPRVIIALFLLALFIVSPMIGVGIDQSLSDVVGRFGMFSVLVLSMVPMIQSGCGLNFGIPVGIIAGILGSVTSIEFGFSGIMGILMAMLIGTFFALIFGALYGALLNKIKGDEMLIATYVGYFFVALMSIMWIILPYKNPVSVMSYGGSGLRQQIPVSDYWMNKTIFADGTSKTVGILSGLFDIEITPSFVIPTGMILFFALMAFIVWAFFKTKLGTSITAVGSNPEYAKASGININKMRLISVMFSTVLAAIGIIVYQQSYGYIQLYTSPLSFTFQSVAAILIGGASLNKASIVNVIVGTILFQGILTMTPTVINGALNIDISDVLRMIVTNGMILYAMTRRND